MECDKTQTIADGLQGRLGSLTWPPVRDLVSHVVTVSDEEIVAAMRLIFERMKVRDVPSVLSHEVLLETGNQRCPFAALSFTAVREGG